MDLRPLRRRRPEGLETQSPLHRPGPARRSHRRGPRPQASPGRPPLPPAPRLRDPPAGRRPRPRRARGARPELLPRRTPSPGPLRRASAEKEKMTRPPSIRAWARTLAIPLAGAAVLGAALLLRPQPSAPPPPAKAAPPPRKEPVPLPRSYGSYVPPPPVVEGVPPEDFEALHHLSAEQREKFRKQVQDLEEQARRTLRPGEKARFRVFPHTSAQNPPAPTAPPASRPAEEAPKTDPTRPATGK